MLVEWLFFAEQNALLCGEDVWLCMCACVRVGFDKKLLLLLLLLKKNWRAAGLELTTLAPSRTIVTDGNC